MPSGVGVSGLPATIGASSTTLSDSVSTSLCSARKILIAYVVDPGVTSASFTQPIVPFGRIGSSAWNHPGCWSTASSVRGCRYSVLSENVLTTFAVSDGDSYALSSGTFVVRVVNAWNAGGAVLVVVTRFAESSACGFDSLPPDDSANAATPPSRSTTTMPSATQRLRDRFCCFAC